MESLGLVQTSLVRDVSLRAWLKPAWLKPSRWNLQWVMALSRFYLVWMASLLVTLGTVFAPEASLAAMKSGDRGAEVRQIQIALVRAGFDPGQADGVFGPKTRQAILQLQRAKGLDVDGVVGPKTLGALGLGSDPVAVRAMGATVNASSSNAPAKTVVPVGVAQVRTTSGGPINIRREPGGPVIGQADHGAQVVTTSQRTRSQGHTWVMLETGGWVAADYLAAPGTVAVTTPWVTAPGWPASSLPASGVPASGVPASAIPASSFPKPGLPTTSVSNPTLPTASLSGPGVPLGIGGDAGPITGPVTLLSRDRAYVNVSEVNIREVPGGRVIGYATKGNALSLTGRQGRQSGRTWLELSTGGWVSAQ